MGPTYLAKQGKPSWDNISFQVVVNILGQDSMPITSLSLIKPHATPHVWPIRNPTYKRREEKRREEKRKYAERIVLPLSVFADVLILTEKRQLMRSEEKENN